MFHTYNNIQHLQIYMYVINNSISKDNDEQVIF